jgi:hypothetical protein
LKHSAADASQKGNNNITNIYKGHKNINTLKRKRSSRMYSGIIQNMPLFFSFFSVSCQIYWVEIIFKTTYLYRTQPTTEPPDWGDDE